MPGLAAPVPPPTSPPPPAIRDGESAATDSLPPQLAICRACDCFVWPEEVTCPHCGVDLATAAAAWAEGSRRRAALIAEVEALVAEARSAGGARPQVA